MSFTMTFLCVLCGSIGLRIWLARPGEAMDDGHRRPGLGTVGALPAVAFVRRRRTEVQISKALPGLFESLARSLRAGLSVRAALGDAVESSAEPVRSELATIVGQIDAGTRADQAMQEWASRRSEVAGIRLAAVAMALAAESGGSVALAIDGVADTLREQIDLQDEVGALSAQAQMSAVLIAVLPAAFAFMAALADPQTLHFMVGTPIGQVCLVAGLALDIAAFAWMRQIAGTIR